MLLDTKVNAAIAAAAANAAYFAAATGMLLHPTLLLQL